MSLLSVFQATWSRTLKIDTARRTLRPPSWFILPFAANRRYGWITYRGHVSMANGYLVLSTLSGDTLSTVEERQDWSSYRQKYRIWY